MIFFGSTTLITSRKYVLKYTGVGGKAFLNSFVEQSTLPEPNGLHFCPFFLEGRTYLFDLDFNLGDDNIYTVGASTVSTVSLLFSLILILFLVKVL
jgi:hypothetical protein